LPVQVTVGGEPAEIAYAGAAPHAVAGLLQVNFRVPPRAPLGDAVPIVLKIGNSQSADGITMAVRSAVQRVLVIDGQPAIRNRLRRVLAGAGYEVLTAQDSQEGLRQANEHPVDLIVLSLAIRDRESREAIQARRPQLRIMVIAKTLGPATLRAADLLGAQGVLTPAMTSQAMLRRVREARE
jgi:CheY-like chemotaxis protein